MTVLPDFTSALEHKPAEQPKIGRETLKLLLPPDAADSEPAPAAIVAPPPERRRWHPSRLVRFCLWIAGVPAALLVALYLVLLITPLPLPLVRDQARALVEANLPPSVDISLGDMSLALEGAIWPVLRFSPVTYSDAKTGAKIDMDALEVGFSPVRAMVGQPGATVTVVGPHIQVIQDLFGPRAASFELVDDGNGNTTARILQGEESFPPVAISADGLDIRGKLPPGEVGLRSDNDWLIYNFEAMEKGLRDVVAQADQGRFSKLTVRGGWLDMVDIVNGVYRRMDGLEFDIAPKTGGREMDGTFAASVGGKVMNGSISRVVEADGTAHISTSVTNIDFSSLAPMLDDPHSMGAVRGTGAMSMDVFFDGPSGKVNNAVFHLDMSGADLRIGQDYYPIATSVMAVNWNPKTAEFTLPDTSISVGPSSATLSGVFVLGLDKTFGPTIGISMQARDVLVQPNDLAPPDAPLDLVEFKGWSATLYGAFGIDQLALTKGDARLAATGRFDMLQKGLGMDLTVAGEKVTADDIKRFWPYFAGADIRSFLVKSITGGVVDNATIKLALPLPGEPRDPNKPVFSLDLVADNVVAKPTDTIDAIPIEGKTRLQIRDRSIMVSADAGQLATPSGPIQIKNAAFVMDSSNGQRVMEISGDVDSGVPALLALAKAQRPDMLNSQQLPVDLNALDGKLGVDVVATIQLGEGNALQKLDYVVNGSLTDFGSSQPIQSRTIDNAQLGFTATQDGYRVNGTAEIDGLPASIEVEGTPTGGMPQLRLAADVGADDLKRMGFDASQFLSGKIKFVAQPMPDGTLQMAVDLQNAGLTIKDLGISKAKGVPGHLQAAIKQDGTVTELSQIDLGFGTVRLAGGIAFDTEKKALKSAQFTNFALSSGDSAQIAMNPIDGGYAVKISGDQFDLKPMLQHFFGLGEGSTGGVTTSSGFNQSLVLDVELKRALGFYKTTAFNVDLSMALKGSNLGKVSLQANMGNGSAISVATNQTPNGPAMSVAFNDMGTLLRLVGVYPRVEGGEGSLILVTDTKQNVQAGEFQVRNFALIDEGNVAQILGSHQGSRALIARGNKLAFRSAKVDFTRRKDRVEITDGMLAGDMVGGTMRGVIYTDQRQYDLAGTYVPLFGLNSAFQKLPLFGPLLGGRDGEGLIGVTFAVRGPLDKPQFRINPASALLPGAFRKLFEYRAKELPPSQ